MLHRHKSSVIAGYDLAETDTQLYITEHVNNIMFAKERKMSIKQAQKADFGIVRKITRETIGEIYPRYYPGGAVDFFLEHHRDESIANDIANGLVFLCGEPGGNTVGTVTVRENEICRLFVLPGYQGNGYGKELLEFAESLIAESYNEIVIDASLPAKSIYLKRGYKETEYHTIKTGNGDHLCYDVMKKQLKRT